MSTDLFNTNITDNTNDSIKINNNDSEEQFKKNYNSFLESFGLITNIQGKIDLCAALPVKSLFNKFIYALFLEFKKNITEPTVMIAQIYLTQRKERLKDSSLLAPFLGGVDPEKTCLVESSLFDTFDREMDLDFNDAPSDVNSKSFQIVLNFLAKNSEKIKIFRHSDQFDKLNNFIKETIFSGNTEFTKRKIDKNTFQQAFKDFQEIETSIDFDFTKHYRVNTSAIDNKQSNQLELRNFFLSILNPPNKENIEDKLHIQFTKANCSFYSTSALIDENDQIDYSISKIKIDKKEFKRFEEEWDLNVSQEDYQYICEYSHLLHSNEIRQWKGSYYTPQIWVKKAHQSLDEHLGDDWQCEYYVWDCCAGSGNLLNGLKNKYNIWASTLDLENVSYMKSAADENQIDFLLSNHVFQFDFLNDELKRKSEGGKVPDKLMDIIKDPEKKLVVLINPPYAEAGNGVNKKQKAGIAIHTKTYNKYKNEMGGAAQELYAQFLYRIYKEIPGCTIAEFSKLKTLLSSKTKTFRLNFIPSLESIFICPGNTFDNVQGEFPIGFKIWDTSQREMFQKTYNHPDLTFFESINATVYNHKGEFQEIKKIFPYDNIPTINNWILTFEHNNNKISLLIANSNDFQSNNSVYLTNKEKVIHHNKQIQVTENNIIPCSVYLTVRSCIKSTWLNDRDQFCTPFDNKWEEDQQFHKDCLIYTLFSNKNNIKSSDGTNHFIPFSEMEIEPKDNFDSHLIINFLNNGTYTLSEYNKKYTLPKETSVLAQAVLDAGKNVYKYYHKIYKNHDEYKINASLYEIRETIRGRTETSGKVRRISDDKEFNALENALKEAHLALGTSLQSKVYEYGFLRNEPYKQENNKQETFSNIRDRKHYPKNPYQLNLF